MEDTRNNPSRYGMPVLRERSGHENVEDLFSPRRERQFNDGLLGAAGYNSKYLLFRPSSSFVRDFGDVVLRLNMALYEFRRLSADHALLLDGDRLQAHYDELNGRVDKTRDRLVVLMDYCNKGFDGNWEETLDGTWPAADAPAASLAEDGDVFDAARQARHRERPADGGRARSGLGGPQALSVLRPADGRDHLHVQRRPDTRRGPHGRGHRSGQGPRGAAIPPGAEKRDDGASRGRGSDHRILRAEGCVKPPHPAERGTTEQVGRRDSRSRGVVRPPGCSTPLAGGRRRLMPPAARLQGGSAPFHLPRRFLPALRGRLAVPFNLPRHLHRFPHEGESARAQPAGEPVRGKAGLGRAQKRRIPPLVPHSGDYSPFRFWVIS